MSVPVEHEKRKKEILEKALDVFIDEGYEDTTFQKIAERCDITRTILYLYFKNKCEIFVYSIKQFMEQLERSVLDQALVPGISSATKLANTMNLIIEGCATQRLLLCIIFDYLNHLRKTGIDPDERVRRRTIRMRHILASLVIDGIDAGDFARVPVKQVVGALYGMIETAIFRLVILGRHDASEVMASARLFIDRLCERGKA